ncbi:MAG: hypothetical protein EOP06_24235 [Proteobacteria bacterium]|nr:MAG: hypothetical protein EOP06_24235 [Pseudomonadota bacterium]
MRSFIMFFSILLAAFSVFPETASAKSLTYHFESCVADLVTLGVYAPEAPILCEGQTQAQMLCMVRLTPLTRMALHARNLCDDVKTIRQALCVSDVARKAGYTDAVTACVPSKGRPSSSFQWETIETVMNRYYPKAH